jgi:hypothetical protein
MKTNRKFITCASVALLGLSLLGVGCDRTVSHTEDVKVRNDGSVKSTEKTVTEHPDGSVSKSETKSDSRP